MSPLALAVAGIATLLAVGLLGLELAVFGRCPICGETVRRWHDHCHGCGTAVTWNG